MKYQRYATNIIVLLFFTFCSLLFTLPSAQAQEIDLSATPEVTPTAAPVAYQLPYPGVLPGHFLYTIKDMRDSLISFLISSPVKKAQFDILQADKRFEAADILVAREQGKAQLAQETVVKAQTYFADALDKTDDAKKEGMDIHDITKTLTLAEAKHMEVLTDTMGKLSPDDKKKFTSQIKQELEFSQRVKQLKP